MTTLAKPPRSLDLPGLDGANPLGFLAALGTLVTVRRAGEADARLRWRRGFTWVPLLEHISTCDPDVLSATVADALRGRTVSDEDERNRVKMQRAFDAAKKAVEDKKKEIRTRGLRGKDRTEAIEAEVRPLEPDRDQKRRQWLDALKKAVSRPELAVGKHIDCTDVEYRDHANTFLEGSDQADREALDLLAAFGSDACLEKSGRIAATPFCFIKGSGQQYFLDTVRQLMELATLERVRQTLFESWGYRDEKLSMRWDPIEARRYALMDRDPSASGNESRTMWMANLLAYRALALFPSAPRRGRLATTAWDHADEHPTFTWPIWEHPAQPDTIRSILQLSELGTARPDRSILRARGVVAALRASRIKVGTGSNYKINFSRARGV